MEDKVSQDNKALQDATMPQQAAPPPRKHIPLFLKIVYIIFGTVCFFGVVKIALQNIFPADPNQGKTVKVAAEKVKWVTYVNKNYGYSVTFPNYLTKSETKYTTIFNSKKNESAGIGFPSLYVSVIPDGFSNNKEVYNFMSGDLINKFYTMQDNQSLQTESGPQAEYWTFKKLSNIDVASKAAVIIQNSNVYQGEGAVNRRILIRNKGKTFIIGSYYSTQQELDDLYKFMMSFKFLK